MECLKIKIKHNSKEFSLKKDCDSDRKNYNENSALELLKTKDIHTNPLNNRREKEERKKKGPGNLKLKIRALNLIL